MAPVTTLLLIAFGLPNFATGNEGCGDLGPIEDGWHNLLSEDPKHAQSQIWLPGTQITYQCKDGMVVKGEASHVCTKGGWQPGLKPTCERISCAAFETEHGRVTPDFTDSYLPGNTLSIECDDGYELQLHGRAYAFSYIICDKNGKWDAYDGSGVLPVCTALVCENPPLIQHASYHVVDPHGVTQNKNTEGARAYYSCDHDYKLVDVSVDVLKCEHTAWVGQRPQCLHKLDAAKTCPEPTPIEHGYFSEYGGRIGHSMLEGTKIYYICEKGYTPRGETLRTCTGGLWTGTSPVCEPSGAALGGCPRPQTIAHGDFSFLGKDEAGGSGLVADGSEVFYTCHTGYRLSSDVAENVVCRDGQWQGVIPSCVIRTSCDAPQDIQNGHWMILGYHERDNKYIIGSKILYECETEYQAYGSTMLECKGEGYWSDYPPKCLPKDKYCEDPGEVENGYYVCEPSPTRCDMFKVGVRIRYMCNPGYQASGKSQQLCLNGGKWSGLKVVCASESTPAPVLSSMMRVNSNTLTIVIGTSCSVLGLLLIVLVVMAFQRRRGPHPRLCHPIPEPPAPYSPDPRAVGTLDEHDRVALIAFADGVQVVLPSYEEATRGGGSGSSHRYNVPRFPGVEQQQPLTRGRSGDYRALPSIPSVLRASRHDTSRHPDNHRSSIVTTTSSTTRDNMSLAFGSIDTMNVSDGTSTTVTIETYDSAASNPSIAASQRATAGSLGSASSNGSIATEDAPLLERSSHTSENSRAAVVNNNSIPESTSEPEDAPKLES